MYTETLCKPVTSDVSIFSATTTKNCSKNVAKNHPKQSASLTASKISGKRVDKDSKGNTISKNNAVSRANHKITNYFTLQKRSTVLKTNNRNIEAIFGKSKYYELCGHFDESKKCSTFIRFVQNCPVKCFI